MVKTGRKICAKMIFEFLRPSVADLRQEWFTNETSFGKYVTPVSVASWEMKSQDEGPTSQTF